MLQRNIRFLLGNFLAVMNIGILTNTYPPNLNGVSITVHSLVEALQKKGHACFVITPRMPNLTYPDYTFPVSSFKLPRTLRPDLSIPYFDTERCLRFFRSNKVELIHSHDTFFCGYAATKIAREMGLPHVHSYHTFLEQYNAIDFPGRKYLVRTVSKSVCNNADLVIAPSAKIQQYLEKTLKVKTPVQPLSNIFRIAHLAKLAPDRNLQRQLDIAPTDFVFITFGRVAKEKGISAALRALAPLMHRYGNIKYIVAGIGNYMPELKRLAKKLKISSYVLFTGAYHHENLGKYANLAQVFLFTSTTDVQPSTIVEAMACGLPVVALNDPAVDYVLQDGYNGFKTSLEALAKVCEKMYLYPKELSRLTGQALQTARRFSQQSLADEFVRLYQQVVHTYSTDHHTREAVVVP